MAALLAHHRYTPWPISVAMIVVVLWKFGLSNGTKKRRR